MSPDFTKPNPALELKLAACRSSQEIQATLLAYQEAQGVPTKYDRVALPTSSGTVSSEPVAEAPKAVGRLLRKAITLYDGTIRLIEADSFYGLDILEAAPRGKRI